MTWVHKSDTGEMVHTMHPLQPCDCHELYRFQQNKMLRAAYIILQLQRLQARFYLHYVQWPAINTAVLSYRHKHSQHLGNTAVVQVIMGEGKQPTDKVNGCLQHVISMCKLARFTRCPSSSYGFLRPDCCARAAKSIAHSSAKPSRQRA